MQSPHAFPAGTVIGGQFELGELIAHGGMGTVYRAVQRGTGAQRAIKLLHPGLVRDARTRRLFLQEAQVSGLIRSDHVVQVIAAGVDEHSGVPWLAMELLQGSNLAEYLDRHGPMAAHDVLVVVQQICHALGAAHDQGIVHRDLKPENVFLASVHRVGTSYTVKLLDFGVAKFTVSARTDTQPVGTPGYMAPEQAAETEQATAATDIWALGLLVFRMLIGKPYWKSLANRGTHLAALWREVLFDSLDLASDRAAEYGLGKLVPPRFDEWLVRCLSRDPLARFQNARAAAAALANVLGASDSADLQTAPGSTQRSDTEPGDFDPELTPTRPVSIGLAATQSALASGSLGSTVKVSYRSRLDRVIVDARPGMSILDVSLANSMPHTHVCGGQARCTTCRIVVLENAHNLTARSEREQQVAEQKQWPDNIRLACQARVMGPVTVRRLILDEEDQKLVNLELTRPTIADKVPAIVLATATRGLNTFTRTALAYDVVHVINRLVHQLGEVIERNGGRVVRCTGPDLLAVFDQKQTNRQHLATGALRAALRILVRANALNDYFVKHFGLSVKVSVGLDDAEIVIGDVGHPRHQQGHVFGEAAIVALTGARAATRMEAQVLATERFCASLDVPLALGRRLNARVSGTDVGMVEIRDFRKPDAVSLVQTTFEQVAGRADEFARAFYDRLWELDPGTRHLFADVDMSTQRVMLIKALDAVIRGFDDLESIREPVRELARRHVAYGTRIIHYKSVGDALVSTLEKFLGDAFVPEVYGAWVETYGKIARIMIEAAMEASGSSGFAR